MAFEARDLMIDLSAAKLPPAAPATGLHCAAPPKQEAPPPKPQCETMTGIPGGASSAAESRAELAALRRELRAALAGEAAAATAAGAAHLTL
jgi:hypothetical protein